MTDFYYPHPDCKSCRSSKRDTEAVRKYQIQSSYGLSSEKYDAMLLAQENACAICHISFDGTPHVDHDHTSGNVRGLLCHGCNIGLGHFRDNRDTLLSAADYLEAKNGS